MALVTNPHDRVKSLFLNALRVAKPNELVGWILSLGGQVQVICPEALKQKVKQEAQKIFRS
jgi:hypothetical protein